MLNPPTRAQVIEHELVRTMQLDGARMARRLALVAEFDQLGAAQELGFRSTRPWLSVECRMDERTARDHVRVAKRLEVWPRVRAALEQGRVTYSQCRALSRAAAEEDEGALLDAALSMTVVALEKHVRALRSAASADLATAEAARERRSLRYVREDDGSVRVWGRLGPAEGAALIEAIESGAAAIPAVEGERAPLDARRADALAAMARRSCPRTTVVLHADPIALATAAGGRVLHLQDGPSIPGELARRLTCDAMVSVKDLNHGRSRRVISAPQRRALETRNGHRCWMPGCDQTHDLDGHHIVHWIHGGPTDLHNLVLLCPYHHRLFHEGGWRMTRERERVLIRNTAGQLVHDEAAPRSARRRVASGASCDAQGLPQGRNHGGCGPRAVGSRAGGDPPGGAERRANARAIGAAENDRSMAGFSYRGLYEQLSSSYGEGFAYEQAVYAVNKVY